MARIRKVQKPTPAKIEQFLGLNESADGQTELKLGEASKQINWRVTEGYKLKKMEGYTSLFDSLGATPIQGQWYGKIDGNFYHVFAHGGKIYKRIDNTNTELGTLTDAPTHFFYFGNKLYILNGYEYKSFDGTTFEDVKGYRPKVAIATPPTGGGTLFENINLLTGEKHQTFSADGTAVDYYIAEKEVNSIDFVKVNGEDKVITTDYTVDLVAGKVTFVAAPTEGVDNIDIGWTKGTGQRNDVIKNRFSMLFGGANDTRVHMWGNEDYKNRYIFSGLAAGVPSAEYFPANNYNDVSSSKEAITDIVKQYDRQIVYKEASAYFATYDVFLDDLGNTIASFPIYPLNSVKGNAAQGQTRIILNNPITIAEGVYEWVATNVRDERNAVYKSDRVQPSLDEVDLSQAVTIDFEDMAEYWLCVGAICWIYNYRINAWYKRDNVAAKNFLVINGELYFGTDNGQIMKFDNDKKDDDGSIINAVWESGFYDFGAEWIRKFISGLWISLKPTPRSRIKISYRTDKTALSQQYEASYHLATFEEADFNDWSFLTSYDPQPFRFKLKAKKFSFFKLILKSDTLIDNATVLSLELKHQFGGEVK